MPLLALILLLLPCLIWSRVIILVDEEPIADVPSHDYFQRRTPFFNLTGLPVQVVFHTVDRERRECYTAFEPASSNTKAFDRSVLVIDMKQAYMCRHKTFGAIFKEVADYAQQLERLGLPPADTAVMLVYFKHAYYPGNPYTEPYSHRRPTRLEGNPPKGLNVALVNMGNDLKAVQKALDKAAEKETLAIHVEQEPGDWNRLYTAWWFYVFVYCMFALDMVMILAATYMLVMAAVHKEPLWTMRNLIVVLAALATLLYAVVLLLPIRSYAPVIITSFASLFINTAFYLLLYLWSQFLSKVEGNKAIWWFQILLVLCICINIMQLVLEMLYASVDKTPAMMKTKAVADLAYSVSRIVLASVFLLGAGYFEWKRHKVAAVGGSIETLRWLSWIGMLTFLTFAVMAALQMYVYFRADRGARMTLTVYMTCVVLGELRSGVLLLVLGVRASVDKPTKSEQASLV